MVISIVMVSLPEGNWDERGIKSGLRHQVVDVYEENMNLNQPKIRHWDGPLVICFLQLLVLNVHPNHDGITQ